ncbi:DNA topoisomerase [Vibrio chagasii]|nr:DNA topoisomerase [Vibrio chagasii]
MSKIVYIAEKPTVARAMASVLGTTSVKGGYMTNSDGSIVVTWVFGHILELVDADHYDEKYKKWVLGDLPIIPKQFEMRAPIDRAKAGVDNKYKRDQLKTISNLLDKTQEVCIATDPDAEGELLGMEVVDFVEFKGRRTRVMPTSLDAKTIQSALDAKKPASETNGLYMGGMARSHIDWVVGINITRALSTYNRELIDSPLNAGRVQTFIVGLISKNKLDIKNFKPKTTYNIEFRSDSTPPFTLKWQKVDPEGRLEHQNDLYDSNLAKSFCDDLVSRFREGGLTVKNAKKEKKATAPKLGFSLTDLQIECSKKLGITAAETLAITQKLYEAKCVTYPRSDCKYMPAQQHSEASQVIKAVLTSVNVNVASDIDTSRKTKVWNDSKIENHHAIMPTTLSLKDNVTGKERGVYEIIAKRYLIQFLPDYTYDSTTIEATTKCNNLFKVTGNIPTSLGWKSIDKDESDGKGKENSLPLLNEGDVISGDFRLNEGKTTPPKPFTEETLLTTLANAHKLVKDEKLAANLKARDKGIGTVATTANIIDQLVKNKFVVITKKKYDTTKKGDMIARIAPSFLLDADTTASLDYSLAAIEKDEGTYESLLKSYSADVVEMVNDIKAGKSKLPEPLLATSACPNCESGSAVKRKGKNGFFWKCVDCGEYSNDNFGKPEKRVQIVKKTCESCSEKTLGRYQIKGSKDNLYSWYCTSCKARAIDINEEPHFANEPCLKCSKPLVRIFSAKKQCFYWVCEDKESCGGFFNDSNHKPEATKPNFEELGVTCPACSIGKIQKRNGQYGDYYTCSNWSKSSKGCTAKLVMLDGKITIKEEQKGVQCPSCKKGIITLKKGKFGDFWSCNKWNAKGKQKCDYSAKDDNGKPAKDS